jgi:hypothetical protein
MPAAAIKPTHKAIQAYYDTLQGLAALGAGHEGAVRTAFQRLLEDTARSHGGTLVAEQTIKVKGKNIRPDGILY